jgi:Na+-driven multidrug efflux pump
MIVPVLVLPGIFGMDGVWMSITAGEVMSILMSVYYFRKYRNRWSAKA